MAGRAPAMYLKLAFCLFLPFLPFRRINKLRVVNMRTGFEPLQVHHYLFGLNRLLAPPRLSPVRQVEGIPLLSG